VSRLRHLPLVAAAVPPALLVVMVARHVCNVPYKDQWGHIPFIVDAARGVFTPAALWHQENEHRIPVARVVQGLLAWWTRWDVRYEAWADVGIALLSFAALVAVVWRTVRPHVPAAAPWVVLIVSVLHFSLAQGYVWIWVR